VNQEQNGGLWVLLGSFELDLLEPDHRVELTNQGNERVAADALRFLRDAGAVTAGEEIVIDNTAATVQGAWVANTWGDGGMFWGSNFLHIDPGGTVDTETWTPALTTAGTYRVYARWTAHANRATDAPYTIHHDGGQTTVPVNQEVNGGEWVPLGSFGLTPGQNHRIVLSDQANERVAADAVKLVRESVTAAGGEIVMDNLDPGAAGDSGWVVNTYTGGGRFWGSNVYQNDPGTPAEIFTWTPTVPAAQRYRVYARWTQDPNRATDAPYTVHHDGGATTVTANQEVNGGLWVALGTYAMSPGLNHRVELSDAADGRVIADAVKLVPDGNARAVVADAMRFVPAETPAFAAVSSSLLEEYVYLNGQSLALFDGGAVAYVHTDHLGTPQKMTDAAGVLVWDAVFRPFGEAESIAGSAANDLRFPGQLYDAETALHYNYFRDYDPSLGRYVESDPIGLDGGLNVFVYVTNNPVNYLDPFGLQPGLKPVIVCPSAPAGYRLSRITPPQYQVDPFPGFSPDWNNPYTHSLSCRATCIYEQTKPCEPGDDEIELPAACFVVSPSAPEA
jgi:RHS repeat-associated protein